MGETKQSDVVLIDRKEYKKRFREFIGKNSPLFKGLFFRSYPIVKIRKRKKKLEKKR
ncbi:MAG: hypothetical protein ACW98D_05085 [Promethearchaeota archaeon]